MDIVLETEEVWKLDFEFEPLDFLSSVATLLCAGDVAMFGIYEPTQELETALLASGAVRHNHLPEFYTAFNFNRREHPRGGAFEVNVGADVLSNILSIERSILRQTDIESFYDHFIAFRPSNPITPLISFHDAACGGILYVSGIYDQTRVAEFAKRLGGSVERVKNPAR